jgi:hypothetical protein
MNARSVTKALLFLTLVAVVFVEISYWKGWLPKASSGQEGDWGTYYSAGYLLRNGAAGKIYDYAAQHEVETRLVHLRRGVNPYLHPPFEAWLFALFTWLSYRASFWLFMALNLALLAAAMALVASRLPAGKKYTALIVGLCFMPVCQAIVNGQDSIIVLFLLALAAWLLDRGREAAAGAAVGLSLFRFHIILPIVFLFFCWKRWRFVGAFAAVAGMLVLISVATMGPHGMRSYLSALLGSGIVSSSMYRPEYIEDPHQMVSLRALVMSAGYFVPRMWQKAVIFAGSGLLVLWRAIRRPAASGGEALEWAVPVGVLVGYHVYGYEASLAVIALALMLARGSKAAWIALLVPPALMLRGLIYLWAGLLLAVSVAQKETIKTVKGVGA